MSVEVLGRLVVPLIGAPMTGVSSPELVVACCRAGIIGTMPATNAGSTVDLAEWVAEIDATLTSDDAPYGINFPLYTSASRRADDLAVVLDSDAALIIASVGSPAPLVAPSHAAGKTIYADVATMHHARNAIALGVDGLILLTAGAGGYTGWMNPFVFVRGVREIYDGPIVLAGGICDGTTLDAAMRLGCDAAYLGTPLIAAVESAASSDFRSAVLDADMDDVRLTPMRPDLNANGVTPDGIEPIDGGRMFAMGHTAHSVREVAPVSEIVTRIRREYEAQAPRDEQRRRTVLSTNILAK